MVGWGGEPGARVPVPGMAARPVGTGGGKMSRMTTVRGGEGGVRISSRWPAMWMTRTLCAV